MLGFCALKNGEETRESSVPVKDALNYGWGGREEKRGGGGGGRTLHGPLGSRGCG